MNTTGNEHIGLEKGLERAGTIAYGVLSFLVSSSLFVAAALFAVVFFTFLSLQIQPHLPLFFASFMVTFSIYTVNKVTDKEEDAVNNPERASLVENRDGLLVALSAVAYAVALLIGAWTGKPLAIIFLLVPLLVAIVYSIRLSPSLPRVKDVFVAKSAAVTISLVTSTSLFAYLFFRNVYIILFWAFFLSIKLFINTTLFDVRDVDGDRQTGVDTVPAVLGIRRSRSLLLFLNTLLLPWVAAALFFRLLLAAIPLVLFSIGYGYWYILRFCQPGREYSLSYDLVVDGEWMLLSGLFLLGRFLVV